MGLVYPGYVMITLENGGLLSSIVEILLTCDSLYPYRDLSIAGLRLGDGLQDQVLSNGIGCHCTGFVQVYPPRLRRLSGHGCRFKFKSRYELVAELLAADSELQRLGSPSCSPSRTQKDADYL